MINKKEKVQILDGPTPLEYLPRVSEELGVEFYIKRDDMTPLAAGGNKIRKLEYSIKEALDTGCTMILTVGGVQTNHGRLTAAAAAKFGLKCAIVTVGTYPGEVSANLLLDRILGADVIIVDPEAAGEGFDKAAEAYIKKYEAEGEKVYYLRVGGSDKTGMLGYYDCALEIKQQMKDLGIEDARVMTTVGSLGTYMGLYCGLRDTENDTESALPAPKLTGISIMPYGETNKEDAVRQFKNAKEAYGFDFDAGWDDFDIRLDYTQGAYNNPVKEVRDAITLMARKEGILLDPCYTGKSFAGIIRMIDEGLIQKGETIIFVHTGGMPGLYTKHHREAFEEELKDGIIQTTCLP